MLTYCWYEVISAVFSLNSMKLSWTKFLLSKLCSILLIYFLSCSEKDTVIPKDGREVVYTEPVGKIKRKLFYNKSTTFADPFAHAPERYNIYLYDEDTNLVQLVL